MKDTILYIDDEKENLESFQLAFWSNYDLLLASSTKEAEPYLSEKPIKVIITDQKMADETGIQFIERMKPSYPDILFIVLTAYAELDIVLDAINTGVFQFIQKPWEPKVMQQVIKNAIDQHNLRKQNKKLLNELTQKNEELVKTNDDLLMLARKFREGKVQCQNNEKLLNGIFRNLPLILLLVDEDGVVSKINEAGLEMGGKSLEKAVGLRGGNVLNCVNAIKNPEGCGKSEVCKDCLINNTVNNSFKYKTDYHKIQTTFTVLNNDKEETHDVLISTAFIDGSDPKVLVSFDDITSHKEIIALKK